MTTPLDAAGLDAIEARTEKATPRTWRVSNGQASVDIGAQSGNYRGHRMWETPIEHDGGYDVDTSTAPLTARAYGREPSQAYRNADFIAHSREDVPALIDALRAAWRENERYRAALAHYADESNWTHLPPPDDVPTENWGTWPDDWYCPKGRDRNGYDAARAALGAPGAREETTP